MPKTIVCLNEELKERLLNSLQELNANKEVSDFIKDLPKCKSGPIQVEDTKKKRKKRKPSAYNIYVKDCMEESEGGEVQERFRKCAISWKGLPDSKKQDYQEKAKR